MNNTQRPVKDRKASHRPEQRKILIIGWIFLAVMIVAAVAAIILLLPERSKVSNDETPALSVPQLNSDTGGSAFRTEETAEPIETGKTGGGRLVAIGRIDCDYTPPETVTIGVLKSVDLASVGETVAANAAANGWGSITYSISDNGSLLLQNANRTKLTPDNYEKQGAYLASSQPEAAARTFLEHSKLVPLLRNYGLELSTEAENNHGEIIFRGTGSTVQSECSVRFSFLYTGDFNQAVVRAVTLEGAIEAAPVSVKKAASNAVTWDTAEDGTTSVTAVELRSVQGLPFYVFTCADGTVAYALAVNESELDNVSGAREIYEKMMADGLREYTEVSGAE